MFLVFGLWGPVALLDGCGFWFLVFGFRDPVGVFGVCGSWASSLGSIVARRGTWVNLITICAGSILLVVLVK